LEIISKLAPGSLKALRLLDEKFSSQGLINFAASFPSSIKILVFSGSSGLNASSHGALLRLPLLELFLQDMVVHPDDRDDLDEAISTAKYHKGLKRCDVYFF
jgi:hypothetical protein